MWLVQDRIRGREWGRKKRGSLYESSRDKKYIASGNATWMWSIREISSVLCWFMLVYLFCCKQNCKSRRAGVLYTYGISKERCSAQRKHSHAKRHTNSGGRMRNAHGKFGLSVWAAEGWEKPWSTSKVWHVEMALAMEVVARYSKRLTCSRKTLRQRRESDWDSLKTWRLSLAGPAHYFLPEFLSVCCVHGRNLKCWCKCSI